MLRWGIKGIEMCRAFHPSALTLDDPCPIPELPGRPRESLAEASKHFWLGARSR